MADPRYYEAWRKPVGSTNNQSHAEGVSGAGGFLASTPASRSEKHTLQVRLDTPGGVTYSPSDLTSHNVIKRMFVPYRLGEASASSNLNPQDIHPEAQDGLFKGAAISATSGRQNAGHEYNFDDDEEGSVPVQSTQLDSDAKKYLKSINMDSLAGKPLGGTRHEELTSGSKTDSLSNEDALEGLSLSDRSHMTTASTRTANTITTLAAQKHDGSLQDWFVRTAANSNVKPFIPPSSFTGRRQDHQRPWDAMRWYGHRALERPSRRDAERGMGAFEEINGAGRVPSRAEAAQDPDSSTVDTSRSNAAGRTLSVADLFIVDPRRYRPLRMVRRSDPKQVLLLCAGVYLTEKEGTSLQAAQAARKAGLNPADLGKDNKQIQDIISTLHTTRASRGGIGVLYCPNDDPLSQDESKLQEMDRRFEVNACKRLEAPPELIGSNTARRAQLRSALAAIELANWEEEGFDKIVIGVEQDWIVQGITTDIWRWKHTGWKLTGHSPQGAPGESVPDRDLWELLDAAVTKYEEIDCNVRFWHIHAQDGALVKRLAEMGATKNVAERPAVVRWRKKLAPTIVDEQQRRKTAKIKSGVMTPSHQGPTLADVH